MSIAPQSSNRASLDAVKAAAAALRGAQPRMLAETVHLQGKQTAAAGGDASAAAGAAAFIYDGWNFTP